MKLFQIIIFLFLFILISKTASSQADLYKFVDSNIEVLKSKKIGPIILIGPEQYPAMIMGIALNGHPHSIIQETYYYLYPIENKTFLTKCIEVILGGDGPNCCKTILLKSKTIQINNDSIFQWLVANDSLVNSERILPYIYQDSSNGVVSYDIGFRMHSFPYSMTILYEKEFQSISFELVSLNKYLIEEYPKFHPNLNYLYNSKTSIFKLYFKLKSILDLYEESFEFDN